MKQRHRSNSYRSLVAGVLVCTALQLTAPTAVIAHDGSHAPAQVSFNRPEAWALKYFTSVTLLSGLETPRPRPPWSVSLGLEFGWVPPLSQSQRFVGFDGTKPEDLNKTPLFLRPRVTVGLPRRLSVIVAVDPPIRSFGLKPRLVAVGLERPIYESTPWTVGLRGYGQLGTVSGAYTCPPSVLAFAPGSPGNLYGCQAASSDTATLRFVGGEVSAAYRPGRARLSPHAAVSVNYMNVAFQVDALTFGSVDDTHLGSRGVTVAGSAGVSYAISRRFDAVVDVFYSPLSVQRLTGSSTNGLFNVRALVAYRLR
jgi:hypothetical protein